MPTIVIRNGVRTLRLTAAERATLAKAFKIARDIEDDYKLLKADCDAAKAALNNILNHIERPTFQA